MSLKCQRSEEVQNAVFEEHMYDPLTDEENILH